MDNDDLEERLGQLADQPVPPIDGAFTSRLETHLRVTGAQSNGKPALSAGRRPLWQPLAGIVVAGVALLVGTLALLQSPDAEGEVLVLSAVSETEVILPDGTALDGNVGLPLPNGTRIEVGETGRATIEDIVLSGGSVAVVVENRLEIIRQPSRSETIATAPTTVPTSAPPTTRAPPSTRPSATTDESAGTTPRSTAPGQTPSTQRDKTGSSVPDRSTSSTTTRQTTPPSPAEPVGVVLTADAPTNGNVMLRWNVRGDAGAIAGWEVVAERGEASRTIALIRDPLTTELTVTQPESGEVAYRVLARTAAGGVAAESNRITITGP